MQNSAVSQNMANPSMFPLQNRVQYLPDFVYSLRTYSLVTLSSQLIFSIHISKASNLLSSHGSVYRKYRTDILKTDYLYQYRRRYLEYRKKIANTDN